MKHSYTVLLAILLVVIAISVFFPRSQFVEGLDMEDLEDKVTGGSGSSDDDDDDHDDDHDSGNSEKNVDSNVKGNDTEQHCTIYKSNDGSEARICIPFKNKQKDNMDLVKAGNSVEDNDTTETFANWNPSW